MNQEFNAKEFYPAEFKNLSGSLAGEGISWLAELRKKSIDKFSDCGFPSPRAEEWRYTNVRPIENRQFVPSSQPGKEIDADLLQSNRLSFANSLVFIDGYFNETLSDAPALPAGAIVTSMAEGLERHPELIEPKLGRALHDEEHGFLDFNTAFFSDGLFVYLPKECQLEKPLQLIFLSTKNEAAQRAVIRNLVVVEPGAELEMVETWIGEENSCYLNAAVSEFLIGQGAEVTLTKVQAESEKGYHFGGTYTKQSKGSRFTHRNYSFGGALVRHDVHNGLRESAEATLDGLFLVTGRQHVDNHTRIKHAQPNAISRERYKGILDGKARGVFQGRVIVDKGAQKTDSEMSNHNLLLSDKAEIDTKPQLEIYADDVKCAHGVTVGQLNENSVFFLAARGIEDERARNMLTFAFANELLEEINQPELKALVQNQLLKRFPQTGIEREWL